MQQKITGIAVDDEPIALEIIRKFAEKVPFLDLTASFSSASAALAHLQHQPANVVFLDINMPDLSGLEFAQTMRQKTNIIFTTAHAEFALKGFEVSATDYLLKPIAFPRFMEACLKAQQNAHLSRGAWGNEDFLFVRDGYDWVRINRDNILFVKADDNYVTFHEVEKKTIVRMTLAAALDKLSDQRFLRVHKSYVISLPKVQKIESNHVLIFGNKIPISSSYREMLIRVLK
jgi:two-component system, LytTR family, response regulator